MTLTCPHCGYRRDIAPDRLPRMAVQVTCPQCRERFPYLPPAPAAAALPAATAEPLTPARAAAWPKAGFWVRLVAAVVDWILVAGLETLATLVLFTFAAALSGGRSGEAQLLGGMIAWSAGPVLGIAYYVGFTGYCGQTPGKMAIRVRVLRTDGAPVGYGRALLRETVGKFLSGLIFGIGYLMVAFDGQKQGLHDKIADTYVVKL